jgi:hypothetical protein
LSAPGQAHTEERRVVVCGDPVGDPDALCPEAVCRADERAGGGELQSLVPGERTAEVGASTFDLPSRDLRPHGRVLEAAGGRQTPVHGDTPFPATEKPRVRPGDRIIPLSCITIQILSCIAIQILCFFSFYYSKTYSLRVFLR